MKKLLAIIVIAAVAGLFALFFLSTPNPGLLLEEARREFNTGRYAAAKKSFLKVRQISKLSSGYRCEASVFYATCFVRENNYKAGIEELGRFINEYPRSFWTPQAYFDLAYCYRNLGKVGQARGFYHKIISMFPITTWASYSRKCLQELELK